MKVYVVITDFNSNIRTTVFESKDEANEYCRAINELNQHNPKSFIQEKIVIPNQDSVKAILSL